MIAVCLAGLRVGMTMDIFGKFESRFLGSLIYVARLERSDPQANLDWRFGEGREVRI